MSTLKIKQYLYALTNWRSALVVTLGALTMASADWAVAQNMIVNGDFESGASNFTSDYSDYTGQIDRTGFPMPG